MTSPDAAPGRACPAGYRYAPGALARAAPFEAETLYVVGGLYGNPYALAVVLELAQCETGPVTIVFNGDFNWFDVDAPGFAALNTEVLRHAALRGNVETELADTRGGADCGCGYPASVEDAEVARSNAIIVRLRETADAFPAVSAALGALPMHLIAEVGGVRAGIVHGDLHSLAGWDYAPESLALPDAPARLRADFADAGLRIIASSHTCTPVAATLEAGGRDCALFNNGAAGMPNFAGDLRGLMTRISTRPAANALYGTRIGAAHIDAVPLPYDAARWRERFLSNWPEGSPAHRSYFGRITRGPSHVPEKACVRL